MYMSDSDILESAHPTVVESAEPANTVPQPLTSFPVAEAEKQLHSACDCVMVSVIPNAEAEQLAKFS